MYPLTVYSILAVVGLSLVCRGIATEQVVAAAAKSNSEETVSTGIGESAEASPVNRPRPKPPSGDAKRANSVAVANTIIPRYGEASVDDTQRRGLARVTPRPRLRKSQRRSSSLSRRQRLLYKVGAVIIAVVGAAIAFKTWYSKRQYELRERAFCYTRGRADVAQALVDGLLTERHKVNILINRARQEESEAKGTAEHRELVKVREALEDFDVLLEKQRQNAEAQWSELSAAAAEIGNKIDVRTLVRTDPDKAQASEEGRLYQAKHFWQQLQPEEEALRGQLLPDVVRLEGEVREARDRDLPSLSMLYQQLEQANRRRVVSTVDDQLERLNRQLPHMVGMDPDYAEEHILYTQLPLRGPAYVRMSEDVLRQVQAEPKQT
ncbi:hypothetical protein TGME49_226380 [Toxoplasma gondii ME49]|uniref:Transmembrane protein n=4 Tax=Toxoplasma gondii TaxID=5811 RepID=S8EXL5_TOXGM|nr:hypothetical protein TGME49_226380 [Toxoplasma gondii ME49]EPT27132.1 hypothetical protein TGME49_226380 [Toxoplasma gondii ME49]KFG45345.1 putative transmembrane protein [Toxoplasma gondii GAB2-2007-GAL-DOM2]KYF43280.1 hypothetical protein TGARI_226380 [Toxoplasma gondii ARI]PIM04070.1 putative transmembrane protein [Toxoplasma gondii COUG]|eukprot:XP_002366291.1 hypothetical protein TGME49_226380 [Toxoplasma gondii ME49]